MDIDFSSMCADQLEKLSKRLDSLKNANLKEYTLAVHVINNEHAIKSLGATMVEVTDIFNDASKSIQAVYAQALMKVQRVLKQPLL